MPDARDLIYLINLEGGADQKSLAIGGMHNSGDKGIIKILLETVKR